MLGLMAPIVAGQDGGWGWQVARSALWDGTGDRCNFELEVGWGEIRIYAGGGGVD